jgi:hypothetical protein
MIYRALILACATALMVTGCGDDGEEATPVATPDAQAVSDVSGSSDTAVSDTAVSDTAVSEEDAEADATERATDVTDTAEEETSSSDAVVEPETSADAVVEDVAVMEDVVTEDAPTPDTSSPPVSFAQVYTEVFEANSCSNGYCHGAGAGGFTISDETGAHFALVNQNAMAPSCGLTQLVVPGDPESSILWRRLRPIALDDGDVCAPKMPQGTEGVDAEASQLVYDWIAGGALP